MRNKYVFILLLIVFVNLIFFGGTYLYVRNNPEKVAEVEEGDDKKEELTVITSFYPMYVAVSNLTVGLDNVRVVNLSEPETGCLHDFQLTTEDVKLLSTGDVFVINGGGAESFLDKVISHYPDLSIVDATEGIDEEEEILAHAFASPVLYRNELENIYEKLLPLVEDKDKLTNNYESYREKVELLIERCQYLALYSNGRNVVLLFEAFESLCKELNLNVDLLVDMDEERQSSAGEVASVIEHYDSDNECFIITEEIYGIDLAETVNRACNMEYIILDPLTRGNYDNLDSYIKGMEENLSTLERILNEVN